MHGHVPIREIARATTGHMYERLIRDSHHYEDWRRQNPDADPGELRRRSSKSRMPMSHGAGAASGHWLNCWSGSVAPANGQNRVSARSSDQPVPSRY